MTGLLEGDPLTCYLIGVVLGFLLGVVVCGLVCYLRRS